MGGMEFVIEKYKHSDNIIEQHIWNYCFSKNYLKLPFKFNTWVRLERALGHTKIEKILYHFIGCGDSLGLNIQDNYHRLYWEYFAKTPFFNSETLLKLFTGVRKMYVERQNLLIKISALMSGKTRAFCTDVANTDAMKTVFFINDNEKIFPLTSTESVQKLVDFMVEQRGKKVFFMLIRNNILYNQLRDILKSVGFIEGQNFFNAVDFLSEIHGIPLNSWEMIKNL